MRIISFQRNHILRLVQYMILLCISLTFYGCHSSSIRSTTGEKTTHEKIGYTRAPEIGKTDSLWIMNDDGSDASHLDVGVNDKDNASMTWSPDGNSIAFESSREGDSEIYTADITDNGGTYTAQNIQQRTYPPGEKLFPAWSNNCNVIAFASNSANENYYNIYQLALDTNTITPITSGSVEDLSPSWSPDGLLIAFTRKMETYKEIYVRIISSGQEVRLTNNNLDDFDPSWSPTGRIIFARLDSDKSRSRLFEMDSTDGNGDGNGDHLQPITTPNANEFDASPQYSPSGGTIVFGRDKDHGGGGPAEVWKLNVQSGAVQNLTQTNPQHEHGAKWKRMGACLKK